MHQHKEKNEVKLSFPHIIIGLPIHCQYKKKIAEAHRTSNSTSSKTVGKYVTMHSSCVF